MAILDVQPHMIDNIFVFCLYLAETRKDYEWFVAKKGAIRASAKGKVGRVNTFTPLTALARLNKRGIFQSHQEMDAAKKLEVDERLAQQIIMCSLHREDDNELELIRFRIMKAVGIV